MCNFSALTPWTTLGRKTGILYTIPLSHRGLQCQAGESVITLGRNREVFSTDIITITGHHFPWQGSSSNAAPELGPKGANRAKENSWQTPAGFFLGWADCNSPRIVIRLLQFLNKKQHAVTIVRELKMSSRIFLVATYDEVMAAEQRTYDI